MNLLTNLKRYFWGADTPTRNEKPAQDQTSYHQLLLSLQQACAHMPEGEAFITLDKGEFSVRMTWNPEHNKGQEPLMFCLNAQGEVIQWTEEKPDGVVDPRVRVLPMSRQDNASAKEKPRQSEAKPSKQQRMMQGLTRYLKLNYAFRYNKLTDRAECAKLNLDAVDDAHHLIYTPVDIRTLNSIALNAIGEGIECWDRDVKRYIESENVPALVL